MEGIEFKFIVKIITIVLGIFIPVISYLFSRVIKDKDDKIKKLFEICDELRRCKIEQGEKISSIKTDIQWIKEALHSGGHQ